MFGYWFLHIWVSSKWERFQTSTSLLAGVGIVWAIIIILVFIILAFIFLCIKDYLKQKKLKAKNKEEE